MAESPQLEGFPWPEHMGRWNRAHVGSYRKGVIARFSSESLDACPYQDKRKPSGRLSWSRSFIAAWEDGWRAADRHIKASGETDGANADG